MLPSSPMRLVTIPFSHYNERARWALDRFGIEYTEHAFMPLFHFYGVLRHAGAGGRRDTTSSRMSTPVLVIDEHRRLRDSGEIVRWASDRYSSPESTLYPTADRREIEQLERHLHDNIGPHTRRIVYYHLLRQRGAVTRIARASVGPRQAWSYAALSPVLTLALRGALRITARRTADSLERLRAEVRALELRLGDRPYLVGDRFTAADLTMACMLAPVLLPPGYGASLPPLEELPAALRKLTEQMRRTAAGQHALRMFAHHRPPAVRRLPPGREPTAPRTVVSGSRTRPRQ